MPNHPYTSLCADTDTLNAVEAVVHEGNDDWPIAVVSFQQAEQDAEAELPEVAS